jgi:hypothetical protein
LKNILHYIIRIGIFPIICGCASSGTLGGGPEDTTPPKLVTEQSTPQNLINYTGQQIKLTFDEFIELKNAVKEIHVSPPLTYRIQTKVRGKTLYLTFNEKEQLKDDVTYIINMGQSIVDFRVGNTLKNFRYVFSTGDKIDSLSVSGKVIDFISGEPVEGATIMLYNVLEDSIVLKERPYYLIITDKEGKFKLENVKQDSFRIYTITDANNNYIYDVNSDGIGFSSYDFFLDTILNDINLMISDPNPPLRILRTIEHPGRIDILFNQEITKVPDFNTQPMNIAIWDRVQKDTLKLFYKTTLDSFDIQFIGLDTFRFNTASDSLSKNYSFKLLTESKTIRIGDSIAYNGNSPIINLLNSDSIVVEHIKNSDEVTQVDSIAIDSIQMAEDIYSDNRLIYQLSSDIDNGLAYLTADWTPGRFKITIPSGSFKDLYGRQNDSLTHAVNCVFEDELSIIIIKVLGLDTTKNYIMEVDFLKGKDYTYNIERSDTVTLKYERILPSPYQITITEDINKNGKWDGPNIFGRIQPEPRMKKSFDSPKSNWDVEQIVTWSTFGFN